MSDPTTGYFCCFSAQSEHRYQNATKFIRNSGFPSPEKKKDTNLAALVRGAQIEQQKPKYPAPLLFLILIRVVSAAVIVVTV